MTAIFRSRAAKRDLEDPWLAIALDSPQAATRILSQIDDRITMLATHPRMGPRRPDIRPAARMLVEGRWLILYQIIPDTDEGPVEKVHIVRVIDRRRDLTPFLRTSE